MRARQPSSSGYAVRAGVRLYYELFGDGPTTVLLLPPWAIVHSRTWKLQVPYLARHFRVLAYDGRGNGHSDRPTAAAAYDDAELEADALAVLDAAGVDHAVCVGLSSGGRVLLRLAAECPDRVQAAMFVAPALRLDDASLLGRTAAFEAPLDATRDVAGTWGTWNAEYWARDLPAFATFFFGESLPEPHSSRQIESCVEWALDTDPETLVATRSSARQELTPAEARRCASRAGCPCLVVHGDHDRIVPVECGRALADALRSPIEVFAGCGHGVHARHPVRFNLLLRQFVESAGAVT